MSPRLTASKEQVQGPAPVPEGMYFVRLDGFKPAFSKDKGSINLNPQLKIVNHPEHNDRIVFTNLNTKAPWIWPDFHHCFGVPITKDGNDSYEFAGFDGPDDNPDAWTYRGPLLGQVGQLYLIQSDNTKGGIRNDIKFYVCKMPNCSEKHASNLVK